MKGSKISSLILCLGKEKGDEESTITFIHLHKKVADKGSHLQNVVPTSILFVEDDVLLRTLSSDIHIYMGM